MRGAGAGAGGGIISYLNLSNLRSLRLLHILLLLLLPPLKAKLRHVLMMTSPETILELTELALGLGGAVGYGGVHVGGGGFGTDCGTVLDCHGGFAGVDGVGGVFATRSESERGAERRVRIGRL